MPDTVKAEDILCLGCRILEICLEHVSIVGPDYVYKYVNPAYTKAYGMPAETIVGSHVADMLGKDIFEQTVKPNLDRCLAGEEIQYEAWFFFKQIGRRYMSVNYLPMRDTAGYTEKIIVFARDVTEQRETAVALVESEQKFRSVAEESPNMIFINMRGRIMFVNKRCTDIMGYRKEEFLHEDFNFLTLVAPEYRDLCAMNLKRHMSGEDIPPYEYALITREGRRIEAIITTKLMSFAGGQAVLGIITDITERKRIEELLRVRLRLMEFAVERSLPEVLQKILDEIGDLVGSPIGFYHFVEPDQKTLTLQAWSTSTGKDFRSVPAKMVPCSVEEAEVWMECVHRRRPVIHNDSAALPHRKGLPEGHTPLVRELVVPIMRSGRIVAILGVGNKASDYNDKDVEIVSYLADVAWEIAMRKKTEDEHHKLEEQLRHSQKLEGIGQLAGGIAHDFNNILSVVVGFAGLLQMKMDQADPLRPFIDEIAAAGQRGAALTHQILAFSRKQVLDVKPADLNEIIRNLEKMLHRLVREDIKIEISLHEKELVILADASQVDHVLINLATNARDAMPGVGRLRIATEYFVMDEAYVGRHGFGALGKYALVEVSDTGTGMDAETLAHIFEPFFTTKEVGKGTGLGLAVVHGIVKQHGGHIEAKSEAGTGTSFKIYLPLAGHLSEIREEKAAEEIWGGSETVLIAEDESSFRDLARIVLTRYGYRVLEAMDGEDAIQKFVENKDDIRLVILDGIMPRKSGMEALMEIRRHCPEVKAIFLSGYSEDIFPGTMAGISGEAAAFLGKPIKPEDLAKSVREVLDQ